MLRVLPFLDVRSLFFLHCTHFFELKWNRLLGGECRAALVKRSRYCRISAKGFLRAFFRGSLIGAGAPAVRQWRAGRRDQYPCARRAGRACPRTAAGHHWPTPAPCRTPRAERGFEPRHAPNPSDTLPHAPTPTDANPLTHTVRHIARALIPRREKIIVQIDALVISKWFVFFFVPHWVERAKRSCDVLYQY